MWDENVEEMVLKLSRKEFYGDDVVRNGSMRWKYHLQICPRNLRSLFAILRDVQLMPTPKKQLIVIHDLQLVEKRP